MMFRDEIINLVTEARDALLQFEEVEPTLCDRLTDLLDQLDTNGLKVGDVVTWGSRMEACLIVLFPIEGGVVVCNKEGYHDLLRKIPYDMEKVDCEVGPIPHD